MNYLFLSQRGFAIKKGHVIPLANLRMNREQQVHPKIK
jgi:hypothetical protein